MSDIVITKTSGCSGDTFPLCATATIRNFTSLDFELNTPVSDFPIPESNDTCNILVKAEGNSLVIRIGWVMNRETTSISSASCVKSVPEQLAFWLNTFQPNSIEDAYSISVDGITREGFIRKTTFSRTTIETITYQATLEFIAGDVVASEA